MHELAQVQLQPGAQNTLANALLEAPSLAGVCGPAGGPEQHAAHGADEQRSLRGSADSGGLPAGREPGSTSPGLHGRGAVQCQPERPQSGRRSDNLTVVGRGRYRFLDINHHGFALALTMTVVVPPLICRRFNL